MTKTARMFTTTLLLTMLFLSTFLGSRVCAQDGLLIQPGVGVGPIRLGMTTEALVSVYGRPDVPPGPIGGGGPDVPVDESKATGHVYQYFKHKVTVLERGGHVSNIIVLNSAFHTANGIGVDSRLVDVLNAFGASGVRKEGQYGPDISYPTAGIRFLFMGEQVMGVDIRLPSK